MKRLAAILAATAIAMLTTGPSAWATGGCVGSVDYCQPSESPTPTPTPTPSETPPPDVEVTATAPELIDTCADTAYIALPVIEGMAYTFPREDGDIWLDPGETIVIEAVALPGYTLTGPDRRHQWTFTALTEEECALEAEPTPSGSVPPAPELPVTGGIGFWPLAALIALTVGAMLLILGRKL